MSPSQPPSARQITQISAAVNFYIHYNDPSVSAGGHNDHAVIAWAVLDDNMTVMPLIASPSDAQTIIQANTLSTDYQIHNPYSQCQACVRPGGMTEELWSPVGRQLPVM